MKTTETNNQLLLADKANLKQLLKVVNNEMNHKPQEFNSNYACYSERLNTIICYWENKYFNSEFIVDTVQKLYSLTDNTNILQAVENTLTYKYFINPQMQVIIADVISDIDRLNDKIKAYNSELKAAVNDLINTNIKIDLSMLFEAIDSSEDENNRLK